MAEENQNPLSEAEITRSDSTTQNRAVRPGGEAEGSTTPQPGDPATPEQASHETAATVRALREGAFGDDKGGSIDDEAHAQRDRSS